ncbi:hypothetical protein DYB28_014138, partial [Aphanomyces astaci]
GRVLISDYCRGDQPQSDRFQAYVASRGYHLLSPSQYGGVLTAAGFADVVAEDRTEHFTNVLEAELARTVASRDEFIAQTSEKDYQDIVGGWESKLTRCADGDQKWGLFLGYKH